MKKGLKKGFEDLLENREQYDQESQNMLSSLSVASEQLAELKSMKRTQGWKILDESIRKELHARIMEKIADDPKIMVLMDLLALADTKTQAKILENEIENLLPEGS